MKPCSYTSDGSSASNSPSKTHSPLDDLVIPEVQHADWEQLCEDGWTLDHLECEGAGHAEATLFSIPEQLAWLRDRIADVPLAGVCEWRAPVCCAGSTDEACSR